MQVFINEKSLQGQYSADTVAVGITTFIETLSILEKIKKQGTIYKSTLLFNEQAIKGIHLNSILSSNGDLLNSFLNNLKSAIKWEETQIHNPEDEYIWKEEIVSGSSVAELAESRIQNNTLIGLLLNFSNSTYAKEIQIEVVKNKTDYVQIDCSHNEKTIVAWLRKYKLISAHDAYDEKLKIPPFDDQTILADARFEITEYKNKGRRAYRLKGTNQLWVVDASEGHLFGKPHIEIFDEKDGLHMGTSIYNEIKLDTSHKVNRRKINLNKRYPID